MVALLEKGIKLEAYTLKKGLKVGSPALLQKRQKVEGCIVREG
jgi:hypothetical protein